ncbi:MAG: SRPBCC domain-containing protein [Bacteroidota bacterium]
MKDFKKYYLIAADPEEVYMALTNPVTIKLWTSEEAVMSTVPDSEFSLWDGSITGKNLEFVENKKIVQQWYFDEASDNSIVTILLHPHAGGTSLELRHTNIPDADFDDIVEGWNDSYFGVLQEFYEE